MERFFAFSEQGDRDQHKDAYVVLENVHDPGDLLIVIADGHKDYGAEHARMAMEQAWRVLSLERPSKKALRDLFQDIDLKLCEQPAEIADFGGTTLTIVYLSSSGLTSANLGNSPAILLQCESSRPFTESHDVYDAREVRRMEENGFRIRGGYFHPPVNHPLPYVLNLSRTLGDAAHKARRFRYAYKVEPFVHSVSPEGIREGLLLVCTDGVSHLIGPQVLFPCYREILLAREPLDVVGPKFRNQIVHGMEPEHPLGDNATAVLVDLKMFFEFYASIP